VRYKLISVGLIGINNHADRIRKIVEQSHGTRIDVVYHPKKKSNHTKSSNNISDLNECDAVFILSPNDTHFDYLKYFSKEFDGYIYCEKPPVSSTKELRQLNLLQLDPHKVFFNFQLRFSNLRLLLEQSIVDGSIGEPINCHISSTQGLAFKKNYANSWRSDKKHHPNGIAETKSIHFLDLLFLLFGSPVDYSYKPTNRTMNGSAYDTCHFTLTFKNGLIATLLMSYAAPLTFEFNFLGTNGILEYNSNSLTLKTPRDSFDKRGFFIEPPEKIKIKPNKLDTDFTQDSLEKSINYFLSHVRENKPISKELFDQSLKTNSFILELEN
jgi:predicted dehydrogenase